MCLVGRLLCEWRENVWWGGCCVSGGRMCGEKIAVWVWRENVWWGEVLICVHITTYSEVP